MVFRKKKSKKNSGSPRSKRGEGKKNSSGSSSLSVSKLFRHCFALIFGRIALQVYLLLIVLGVVYVLYLDATIRDSFEGKKWQLPARVYARPLELFVGAGITTDELEAELRDLGYREGYATQPGSYARKGERLTLYSRGYSFLDGREPAVQATVVANQRGVRSLSDLQGADLPILRLEPLEIGAIYPAHKEDRVLLRLEEVPPLLTASLLAIEDHRFYEHSGIVISAIARAALQNLKSGGVVQGGSTITQQLVKNYYLSHQRTLQRKAVEAVMALLLERRYEKELILQAYLNEVYLGQAGDRAIHGFGLASYHYFNRSLADLSVEKLALLVAIVRGPTFYDPWRYPERALQRRNRVIDAMASHNLLQAADAEWAKTRGLGLGKASRSQFVFPAYIDLVRRQLREFYSDDVLTSNGLKIYTSFDPRIQRSLEYAAEKELARKNDKDLQVAAVVAHPSTGEVLALLGGRKPRYAGFNRALDAHRSIGSIIKPFIYLTAFQRADKYRLTTLIDDSPVTLTTDTGVPWQPRNFDRESHGSVPLVTALAKSYNQATARLGDQLGLEAVTDTLRKAGLKTAPKAVPSLYIGTTQLSPFDVAGMYQTISAQGHHSPLKAIRSVLDANDQPMRHFSMKSERAWSAESNYLLQNALLGVSLFGSAQGAYQYLPAGWQFAGKTGTSGQQRDSWFAGYSGDLLATVWMGHDDNRQAGLTGSNAALPLWARLMRDASRRALTLPLPHGFKKVWVDWPTGRRSFANCETAIELPFASGEEPSGAKVCTGY